MLSSSVEFNTLLKCMGKQGGNVQTYYFEHCLFAKSKRRLCVSFTHSMVTGYLSQPEFYFFFFKNESRSFAASELLMQTIYMHEISRLCLQAGSDTAAVNDSSPVW